MLPTAVNPGNAAPPTLLNGGSGEGANGPVIRIRNRRRAFAVAAQAAAPQGGVLALETGDRLRGDSGTEYTVVRRIGEARDTGEADVFLCEGEGRQYAVKVFRRDPEHTDRKLDRLRGIRSEYVAAAADAGRFGPRWFEVTGYCPWGSLADELKQRTFPFAELEKVIIPQLAEGLHALHRAGVLHRDIKPGNLLWRDREKKHIAIIDFGLSSVTPDPADSVSRAVSVQGGTPAYTAPEALRGFCCEESDYYSMGITLYELYCGKLPFACAADAASSRITRPEGMEERLYRLILGLTYNDITLRHRRDNPNRRWGYAETVRWRRGEELPVPGAAAGMPEEGGSRRIPAFSFQERTYRDADSLCAAMAADWQAGAACIARGTLAQHLARQKLTETQALWMSQITEIAENGNYSPDRKLMRVIRTLCPDRAYIPSPLGCFGSVRELGEKLLLCLGSESPEIRRAAVETTLDLLSTDILSAFQQARGKREEHIRYIRSMERMVRAGTPELTPGGKEALAWEIAYCFSGERTLKAGLPDGAEFRTPQELKRYLMKRSGKGGRELYRACACLLEGEKQLKPRVYGWLRVHGVRPEGFCA